jgi:hypothetical protein
MGNIGEYYSEERKKEKGKETRVRRGRGVNRGRK